jgi:2,4-dienoyl-CoA reductase-like NADH-dependent reductase (Old Yellow Enzyme family)
MTAMGTGFANPDGTPSERIIKYYEERAKGGVGLIVTEVTRVNGDHGKASDGQLSVSKDENIEALKMFADRIHQYGTNLFIQLHHPGRQNSSAAIGGQPVVGPSAIPCGLMQEETRALSTEEVEGLVEDFVNGAKRAQAAGIDGVELHAAHGFCLTNP